MYKIAIVGEVNDVGLAKKKSWLPYYNFLPVLLKNLYIGQMGCHLLSISSFSRCAQGEITAEISLWEKQT